MVSVGTVISLIAGGAIIAGGIAVFSNLDRIGGAFTRGVEESITKPFSDYLDNLFKTSTTNTQSSIAGETVPFTDTSTVSIPADTTINPDGTVSSSTPPLLNLSPQEKAIATETQQQNVIDSQIALDKQIAEREQQNQNINQTGYYFVNFEGSALDTQLFLRPEDAPVLESLKSAANFLNIQFLGKSKLGPAGFQLFGESKGYL